MLSHKAPTDDLSAFRWQMDSDPIITNMQVHLSSMNNRPNNKPPLLIDEINTREPFIIACVLVGASLSVPRHIQKGQRITLGSLLSLSITEFGD